MSYINRLYFRKDTGYLLYWYEYETISNNTPIPTIEQDIASIKPLRDFGPENIYVVEVKQEDLLTREKVRKANEILYNPETEQLIFDIDSGILVKLEERFVIGDRVTQIENNIENLEIRQRATLDALAQVIQEKADTEQAIAELSILLAGGGE